MNYSSKSSIYNSTYYPTYYIEVDILCFRKEVGKWVSFCYTLDVEWVNIMGILSLNLMIYLSI